MLFKIEKQVNNHWSHLCDGITSKYDADKVAEVFSTHATACGKYRVIKYYSYCRDEEVVSIWDNGNQTLNYD
jgi:hypothetical protein